MENSLAVPLEVKQSNHWMQQFCSWVCTQRNENTCPPRNVYVDIHDSIIHNSKHMATIHSYQQMDK